MFHFTAARIDAPHARNMQEMTTRTSGASNNKEKDTKRRLERIRENDTGNTGKHWKIQEMTSNKENDTKRTLERVGGACGVIFVGMELHGKLHNRSSTNTSFKKAIGDNTETKIRHRLVKHVG